MQSLDIISVNLWSILISLANLLILFFILKKFLYGPVKKMLAERASQIDASYEAAAAAEASAQASKSAWDEKMLTAEETADSIIKTATHNADRRSDAIVAEAREKAEFIIRQAEADAELEMKKAQENIKHEIVTVSTALAEKILEREINENDHKELINSFIDAMGDAK